MSDAPVFRRDELLAGLPGRRAATLVFAIEARTARLVDRSRRALAMYETERTASERERAFLQALAGARDLPIRISVQDLERYAADWASLVPTEPALRAAIVHRLAEKYRLVSRRVPGIQAALGLTDPEVTHAYKRAIGRPIATVFTEEIDRRERLRWLRASLSRRLETLPPFWMAFALALTETIVEGILSIPIAVAGIGPLAGIVLLVILGLVNVLTLAALVEAITRTGQMRYGETYFGRLVSEYLGTTGAVAFSVALFVFNIVCVLVYFLGFASVLGDATGISLGWWVALIFVINIVVVRRDSLDATVASALLIGAVNIGLIIAICAIGLSHLDPANFAGSSLGGGLALDAGLLQLVFGVVLVAYFGHTSAGNAAKLILREDMTGRALLGGNVAAMATVIGLYCLGVLAINGAVGADALSGTTGTSITPLAEVAGPSVLVLGAVYVTLGLGIASVYGSLGLANQIREWLPSSDAERPGLLGRSLRSVTGPRGRRLVSLAPVGVAFIALEALIAAGAADFTASLSLVGTLTIPLLGGVFPMLLVAAARHRGEMLPQPVVRWIGRPSVVAVVAVLYVAAIALHGLVIWTGLIERAAAILVAVIVAAIAIRAARRGSFRPRAVVELRVSGEGGGVADLSATDDGAPMSVTVVRAARPGVPESPAVAASTSRLGDAGSLGALRIDLPDRVASELRLWIHRVDDAGDSVAWPVTIRSDQQADPMHTGDRGVVDLTTGPSPRSFEFEPSAD